MKNPIATSLIRRWERLASDRGTTESTWQEIADHELGRRDFTAERTPGEQRQRLIYDDTSKQSGSLLAGAMHSLLTNPATPWFDLRFADPDLNEIPEAARWLHMTTRTLRAAVNRPRARFHSQMAELYIDEVYFGTAALFVHDAMGDGVRFSARPLREIFASEDESGVIDTVFRFFPLSNRQAISAFGDNAPELVKKQVDDKPEDMRKYLHAIYPRDDFMPSMLDVSGMPFQSVIIDMDTKSSISQGGFHEFPIAIPRWSKDAGEIYGRGPGWEALSDQRMLNEMKRVRLKAAQKAVDPPLLVDSDSVLGKNLFTTPGSVIPINASSSILNPPVQALESRARFDVAQLETTETRQQVMDAFQHQLLEMIRDPRMTATQVLEISAQVQRHLAPILGRQQTELLDPVIERVFAIEARAGRIPAPPAELSGQDLRIEYVSPIARAQKANDAKAIIDVFTAASNLSQVDPGVLDVIDFDVGLRTLADAMSVPPTIIRSLIEVQERREAAAALAQEKQALEQAGGIAKVASGIAPLTQAMNPQSGGPPA